MPLRVASLALLLRSACLLAPYRPLGKNEACGVDARRDQHQGVDDYA